jgi:alkylated DNA repair dioxygenase AlkB
MEVGACFDSVLCNRYRDGQDSIGWHADDEPALGPDPVVASLSLGAPRRFLTRPKSGGPASEVVLGPGDLLVMPKGFQRTHQHSMPKTAKPVGERISFTFRVMNP